MNKFAKAFSEKESAFVVLVLAFIYKIKVLCYITCEDGVLDGCSATVYYEEGTSDWDSTFEGLTAAVWGSDPTPVEISLSYVLSGDQLVLVYVGTLPSSTDLSTWETLDSADSESTYSVSTEDDKCFYRVVGD